jgi:L-fuconolactonase
MSQRILDTHVHVWDLTKADYPWLKGDTSLLNQTWEIGSLENERVAAGVTEGILVQAAGNDDDTDHMLKVAASTSWISGVVIWLPLLDPEAVQRQLEEKHLSNPYFCGVRHQIHDESDSEWLLQNNVIESLKILAGYSVPFDVVAVKPAHIKTALAVADRVPALNMVFDHLSQPPISSQQRFGEWGELMSTAAKHKAFSAKISGLGTASGNFKGRTKKDIQPYVEFAIEKFGVERCFCGGDWPVSLLAGEYSSIWKIYRDIFEEILSVEEQESVLYRSAKKFYTFKKQEKASNTWK